MTTTPYYEDERVSVTILRANALALPLADASVDLVVTSPPYFGLRSYQDGGKHYEGQIGSEATPAEFVDALIAATREMVRVLKPSGSIWVNLGDKYASTTSSAGGDSGKSGLAGFTNAAAKGRRMNDMPTHRIESGVRQKSLLGIPWRYTIRCIDELGLILRAEVIWSKPNGLPESVTDRVRRSHETWFHFTKQPRYYSAVDEIREENDPRWAQRRLTPTGRDKEVDGKVDSPNKGIHTEKRIFGNPLGKLPGSVWTIPTEPLRVPDSLGVDHFAAFPTEWPRRIIQGWSPREVCTACGEGRRPVADVTPAVIIPSARRAAALAAGGGSGRTTPNGTQVSTASRIITGYACACPDTSAPTTPGVVLDPFGGTGTTALVADVLGRHGITVDLSADYCRLAEWRTTDPKQRAKAARVEAAEPVPDDQPSLLEEESA